MHRPQVLLLDEPTPGLDPMGVRQLRETVLQLNRDLGLTVFMNTHQLSEVSKVCTTIGVLSQGELIYKDNIEATVARFPNEASLGLGEPPTPINVRHRSGAWAVRRRVS